MLKGIDHVAIAVDSIDGSLPLWTALLGFDHAHTEDVPSQGVRVALLTRGPFRIELMEALSPDSPVGRFLARKGPGLHHICLDVTGIEGHLASLAAAGVALIDEEPREGAAGRRVAFVHPKAAGGVLLELSEEGAEPACGHG